jgi:hypothetical protein
MRLDVTGALAECEIFGGNFSGKWNYSGPGNGRCSCRSDEGFADVIGIFLSDGGIEL